MSRKRREVLDNATYHVASRVNYKEMRLEEWIIKDKFLEIVEKVEGMYTFTLINFVIMDNHFHLLIKVEKGAELPRIMQQIKCKFARWLNKEHNQTGHVWGERYFSTIITSEEQFWREFNYQDENPRRAKIAAGTGSWSFSGEYFHRSGRLALSIPSEFGRNEEAGFTNEAHRASNNPTVRRYASPIPIALRHKHKCLAP
jgi:REP element-mobilizing transposase RayT